LFIGKALHRRQILRGLGTAVTLPFLDAMTPALSHAATSSKTPCRMAFLYVPNGIVMEHWVSRQKPGAVALPGQLPRISWEAVAAAQKLAALSGGEKAEAIVLGAGIGLTAAEVAKADLAAVHVADHDALRAYTPGGYIGALAPAIRAGKPDFVVFPHTYQSIDYVPRLAQEVGAGLLPEVTGFAPGDGGLVWTRPILGGKLQSKVRVKGESAEGAYKI